MEKLTTNMDEWNDKDKMRYKGVRIELSCDVSHLSMLYIITVMLFTGKIDIYICM